MAYAISVVNCMQLTYTQHQNPLTKLIRKSLFSVFLLYCAMKLAYQDHKMDLVIRFLQKNLSIKIYIHISKQNTSGEDLLASFSRYDLLNKLVHFCIGTHYNAQQYVFITVNDTNNKWVPFYTSTQCKENEFEAFITTPIYPSHLQQAKQSPVHANHTQSCHIQNVGPN